MGRSSAGPPCAGASAAASRVAPGTPTTAPVGAGGAAPQAAPGPSGACGAVDAGGVAPRARGARPGSRSRSPWPPPTGSRAGPARGCGAAPGRRTTTPHETPADEGRQARRHRSPSSSGSCWSPYRSTSGTPRAGPGRGMTVIPAESFSQLSSMRAGGVRCRAAEPMA
jgi:hypothetical protein